MILIKDLLTCVRTYKCVLLLPSQLKFDHLSCMEHSIHFNSLCVRHPKRSPALSHHYSYNLLYLLRSYFLICGRNSFLIRFIAAKHQQNITTLKYSSISTLLPIIRHAHTYAHKHSISYKFIKANVCQHPMVVHAAFYSCSLCDIVSYFVLASPIGAKCSAFVI